MPDRVIYTAAVVVAAIAVLVGVFVGIPLLLTAEGIDVNAGLIIGGAAALGTVGTLFWAVFNGLELRRQADGDRRQANAEKVLDQARRVSAWAEVLKEPDFPYARRLNLTNSSAEPIYEVVVYLVWVQGSAPGTGEAIESHYRPSRGDISRVRAIVQVLPPGNYWLKVPGPTNSPMQGRLGVEVAFTDGAGRHWVRRVPTGNLQRLDATPVQHYGIGRTLPKYDLIKPW
jgi:hypothetical protein